MKKIFLSLAVACLIITTASCGKNKDVHTSDDKYSSDDVYGNISDDISLDMPMIDPSEIQEFPKEKMSHDVMDDGNYHLRVQTISGDKSCIRDFASKREKDKSGKDIDKVYASLMESDLFEWYYSDGRTTFSFDDEAKTYEIKYFKPLFVQLFSSTVIAEGECVFFEVDCKYKRYKLEGETSIMHFYRKSDGSWLGFQYMFGEEYEEVNLVLASSEDYPSYAKFEIPSDYKYYFESGDNVVSMDWS